MINLDDKKIYKKLDKNRVAQSIEFLAMQMQQVLKEAHTIKIPKQYRKVTNVVVNGMGGSNLGIRLICSALSDQIKLPVTITSGYQVAASVGKNTLYLLSSYSGNTEEVLSVYKEVKKRGAKILVICQKSDNKLARLMIKENLPGYMFKTEANPSKQPRLGLGYAVLGAAMLFSKIGLLDMKEKDWQKIIAKFKLKDRMFKPDKLLKTNKAKQSALKIYGHLPVAVSAEFLSGNLNILRNQFNECSKNFAAFLELPDLNHFALESLINPKNNKSNLLFLFFDSALYHRRVQLRAFLTKQVIKKNKVKILEYKLTSATKLEQALEMMQFGCWLTFYLAMLNNVDPVKIPWVDWFKKELK